MPASSEHTRAFPAAYDPCCTEHAGAEPAVADLFECQRVSLSHRTRRAAAPTRAYYRNNVVWRIQYVRRIRPQLA